MRKIIAGINNTNDNNDRTTPFVELNTQRL